MKGRRHFLLFFAALLLTASCGYNLVGHGGQFPAGVDKVAVPIFRNETEDTEIARRLTNHFIRELMATGKVKVVPLPEAQAEVKGTVTRYDIEPISFDADRNAIENRLIVKTNVSLFLKGKTEPVFVEKGVSRYYEYEVSPVLAEQRREEDVASEVASRELSQKIITLMTEGF